MHSRMRWICNEGRTQSNAALNLVGLDHNYLRLEVKMRMDWIGLEEEESVSLSGLPTEKSLGLCWPGSSININVTTTELSMTLKGSTSPQIPSHPLDYHEHKKRKRLGCGRPHKTRVTYVLLTPSRENMLPWPPGCKASVLRQDKGPEKKTAEVGVNPPSRNVTRVQSCSSDQTLADTYGEC